MKFSILILILFIQVFSFGQDSKRKFGKELFDEVDTSNYYNYLASSINGSQIRIAHLDIKDALPVIMEELENAGYEWLYEYSLFKIDSINDIVLSAYTRKSNFGFLYINSFKALPSILDRQDSLKGSVPSGRYLACEETPKGEPNFKRIAKFPSNIYILGRSCYWYELTDNSENDKYLITKEIAIKILRQDVKAYLAKTPKPTK